MKALLVLVALFVWVPAFGVTCTVTEFEGIPVDANGRIIPVATLPPLASQLVTFTATTASSVLNVATNFIRIQCSAASHFTVGTAPTATSAAPRIAANTTEYFGVVPSAARLGTLKIAFVEAT